MILIQKPFSSGKPVTKHQVCKTFGYRDHFYMNLFKGIVKVFRQAVHMYRSEHSIWNYNDIMLISVGN